MKAGTQAVPQRAGCERDVEIIALDQHSVERFHSARAEDFNNDKWPMAIDGLAAAFYDRVFMPLDIDLDQLNRSRAECFCPPIKLPSARDKANGSTAMRGARSGLRARFS